MLPHLESAPGGAAARAARRDRRDVLPEAHGQRARAPARRSTRSRRSIREHEPMLGIASAEALVSIAQMNVIEVHTWNATTRAIDRPDRIVFRSRSGRGRRLAARAGGGVTWCALSSTTSGSRASRRRAAARDCTSWCRSTPQHDWDTVKRLRRRSSCTWPRSFRSASSPRAARRTASGASTSTICATPSARPPSPPGRRARVPGWACRCRSRGPSSTRCARARTGTSPASASASTSATRRGSAYESSRRPLSRAMKQLGVPSPPVEE